MLALASQSLAAELENKFLAFGKALSLWLLLTLCCAAQIKAQGLTSYFVSGDQSHHLYYVGGNQHVGQIFFDGQTWINQDLTALCTPSVLAASGSAVTSFFVDADGSSHLFYVGANQHVYHMYFNGSGWVNQDISAWSGASVLAGSGTGLTSYFVAADGSSHVYYVGSDRHIHQLFFSQAWGDQDLTALSGAAVLPVTGSALTSFFVDGDGSSHVFYTDTNQHIEQVFFYGDSWINQDVTEAANGVLAANGTGLTSYFVDIDGSSHIYFIGVNQHVYQVFFYGNAWISQDLTAAANGALAAIADGDSSYFVAVDGSSHVYYVGENQHVYQLYYTGQNWGNQDLTALSNASVVAVNGTGVSSYFVSSDGSSHIYYEDTNQHTNELVFDGHAWYDLDLMQIYSVSGQVLAGSSPVPGVNISLTGASAGSTTTDANGNYSFGLAAGGTYTVTPSASGYSFSPASQTFSNSTGNESQAFAASTSTLTVSGQVSLGASGLSGVTVALSGSASASTITNTTGMFSFSVQSGGYYTITPARPGYKFNPASSTFNSLSNNPTITFTATGGGGGTITPRRLPLHRASIAD